MRKLVREPLVHFLLLGALLFALDRRFGNEAPAAAPAHDTRIVVDATVRNELALAFERTNARKPESAELDELVARWIDRQILYREGLLRGLERGDMRIVQRVADKMAFVLRSQVVVPEPSDAELERWFREHEERYRKEELIDFVHVFVEGHDDEERARELLTKLEDGADPNGLGDVFSGGRRYRRRKLGDLEQRFGDDFAAGIATQPAGRWALHRSRLGFHVVRVEQRTPAKVSDFAQAKDEVRRDFREAEREKAQERAMQELRARWQVVEQP